MSDGARSLHYFIVNVFPYPTRHDYAEYVGAAAGCWVCPERVSTNDLEQFVKLALVQEGWVPCEVTSHELVAADDQSMGTEARAMADQAVLDGFVCHLHRVRRESDVLRKNSTKSRTLTRW